MLIFPLTVLYKNVSEIIGDPKEFKMAIQEQERIGTYFSFESSLKRQKEVVKINLPDFCKTAYLEDLRKNAAFSTKPVAKKSKSTEELLTEAC